MHSRGARFYTARFRVSSWEGKEFVQRRRRGSLGTKRVTLLCVGSSVSMASLAIALRGPFRAMLGNAVLIYPPKSLTATRPDNAHAATTWLEVSSVPEARAELNPTYAGIQGSPGFFRWIWSGATRYCGLAPTQLGQQLCPIQPSSFPYGNGPICSPIQVRPRYRVLPSQLWPDCRKPYGVPVR